MDALKSYSGEESTSEDEAKKHEVTSEDEAKDRAVTDSVKREEDKSGAGSREEETSPANEERSVAQEEPGSPPASSRAKEEEKRELGSRSVEGHRRRRRSRSRSRDRGRSPDERDRESSRHRRSRDHHHQNSSSRYNRDRRGYERHRSRSRSPPSRSRRGSYHRRRSRSRSPPNRRRRSRSPDYHRRRHRRSSSGDRRGSRRRSKSPSSERGSQGGEKVSEDGRSEQHVSKPETAQATENDPTGLPSQQQSSAAPLTTDSTLPPSGTTAVASPGLTPGQSVSSTLPSPVGVPLVPAGVAGVPLLPPPDLASLTPEQRLELILAANRSKGPQLPTFMNPTAMNPIKFQQIKQKRKLLWSSKKAQTQSHNQWEAVSLGNDDKETAKFRRLMGISSSAASTSASGDKDLKEEHSKRLNVLEQQYESSRYQTHIARGVGLGYGSAALTTELPSQKETGDKLDEKL